MKKFLIAFLFAFIIIPQAFASDDQTISATATQNVNVRVRPTVNSARIDHLVKGQTTQIKRRVKGWCEIDYKKYQHAYVNCAYLKMASAVSDNSTPLGQQSFKGAPVELNANGNWVLGAKDAKVVIEEFGDLQCPFCSNYFTTSFPQIFSNYIATGKVKYVYYNFPLDFHEQAAAAAIANLCAGDQNKYWQMHEYLLGHQDEWDGAQGDAPEVYENIAQKLGLKADTFNACLVGKGHAEQINKDIVEANKRNVTGTPTFYINGQEIVGAQPYETLSAAIEKALGK